MIKDSCEAQLDSEEFKRIINDVSSPVNHREYQVFLVPRGPFQQCAKCLEVGFAAFVDYVDVPSHRSLSVDLEIENGALSDDISSIAEVTVYKVFHPDCRLLGRGRFHQFLECHFLFVTSLDSNPALFEKIEGLVRRQKESSPLQPSETTFTHLHQF